ncbi:MAG: hypothetical protein HRF47_13715 [Chloroflexota bacterium]
MTSLQVRILDDELQKRDEFCQRITSTGIQADVEVVKPEDLRDLFQELLDRQNQFRTKGCWASDVSTIFDETDILIVDNELRDFFVEQRIFTDADHVAYMARCFSRCKHILVVNRVGYNPFDTTGNFSYLDQFDAFSDLEIGQSQLSSKALWGTGKEDFHPWYWFVPQKWLEEFDRRVEDAKNGLRENKSILRFFGLEEFRDWLPRRILQTLGAGREYTFGEFVRTSSFALAPKDRATLPEHLTDETIDNLAPIVAARLWKWLEFQVLPELDILSDAPHLVSRFPSLLEGDHGTVETWNAVAARHVTDVPNLSMTLIKAHRFKPLHWLTRPAWHWRKVMNDENVPDVREPWKIEYVPFGFCEDTSSFLDKTRTVSYRTATDSSFSERYLKKVEGVEYMPPQRLAM